MSIETKISKEGNTKTIGITGKFNFNMLNEFRDAYNGDMDKQFKYIIDMRSATTIDSSALGMLLHMQRQLDCKDGDISIVNCNHDVRKILSITNFGKKFSI